MPPEEMVFTSHYERKSDVDGFTVVARKGRRPKIHLLRPWNECNTTRGKSGKDTMRVKGSREHLMKALAEHGFRHGGIACLRCFRRKPEDDAETPVEDYGDPEVTERVRRSDDFVDEPAE